jgi:guanylate kinase
MDRGSFIVVSAPSGTGKSSLCQRVIQALPEIVFSVSYTTRHPRPDEVNGQNYFFISREEFQRRITQGEFAEWSENYGNLYGTSLKTMKDVLAGGGDLLLDIEPRGAKKIKQKFRGGVFVFVLPPSREELLKRLAGRGHETDEAIAARYAQAENELKEIAWYDYVIFNDDLDKAVNQLIAIYIAQRCRRSRLQNKIRLFMKNNKV